MSKKTTTTTREHATYDIRDSYYKPVAPALCWHPTVGINAPPEWRTFFSLSGLRFLPPGVGLTGSSRPSKVLLEFKALILKTEHKQTLQSVAMLDCIEQILISREHISHLG